MAHETRESGSGTAQTVIEVAVRGLHCGGCVARLTKVLEHQPGVHKAEVDLLKAQARLTLASADALTGALAAIEAAGFYADYSDPGQGSSGV